MVRPVGKVSVASFVPEKALLPIVRPEEKVPENVTEVRLVPANAPAAMVVTVFGMVTEVRVLMP